jgi:eukaryotic-like serine/threonine-protein kinase
VRPSLAVTRPGWTTQLAGDLDNIVLMAMRKEPDRRYESVDRLAGDVRLYLKGLPVSAREDTLRYRAGKFLKRHRFASALAALALVSLAGVTGFALRQAREANMARHRAEQAMRQAERANSEAQIERDRAMKASARALAKAAETEAARVVAERRLTEMVTLANHSVSDIQGAIERLPGSVEARRQLANTTAEFLDGLARETGGDRSVQRVLMRAYIRLGDVQGMPAKASLGNTEAAFRSYGKADSILVLLRKENPRDPELRLLESEISYRLGTVLQRLGRSEQGIRRLEQGLELTRALVRERPDDVEALLAQGVLEQSLTREYNQVNLTRAVDLARSLLATHIRLSELRPGNDKVTENLSIAHTIHASIMAQVGDIEGALADARKSAEIRERLLASHPQDVEFQRNLMIAYGHVGDRLGNPLVPNVGDPRGARQYYEKARKIAETMIAADPSNKMATRDLVAVSVRLGSVMARPEEREESISVLRRASILAEEQLRGDPRNVGLRMDNATAYEFMGKRHLEAGAYADALAAYRSSLAIAEQQSAADPQYVSARHQAMADYKGIAEALARLGDRSASLALLEHAEAAGERLAREGPNRRSMQRYPALVQSWYGSAYEALATNDRTPGGRLECWRQAAVAYARSLELWTAVEPGFRKWLQPEIRLAEQRLEFCRKQASELQRAQR